jgi:hypothetical protein
MEKEGITLIISFISSLDRFWACNFGTIKLVPIKIRRDIKE